MGSMTCTKLTSDFFFSLMSVMALEEVGVFIYNQVHIWLAHLVKMCTCAHSLTVKLVVEQQDIIIYVQ